MRTGKAPGAYEVGYGKPPVATRFKPGQSGNPRGRPKRVPTLAELVQREAKRKISVVEDGERRTISKIDALAKRLMQEALKGNARATQQVIQLLSVAAANAETAMAASDAQTTTDQALMQGLIERLATAYGASPGDAASEDPGNPTTTKASEGGRQ